MRSRPKSVTQSQAMLALLLLIPVPTAGVLISMLCSEPTTASRTAFIASKIWVLLLPLLWHVVVIHSRIIIIPPTRKSLTEGLITGLVLATAVVGMYVVFGPTMLYSDQLRNAVTTLGVSNPPRYILGAVYWICINSMLEEYVWRWFCTRRLSETSLRKWRVPIVAIAFTLHHIVALCLYCSPLGTSLASFGIFIGSVIWSWLYLRHGNIWGAYLSHALVDTAIFAIGFRVLF